MNEEQKQNTPFETAGTIFAIYTPRLEALVKELSTGELRRLVNALIQYPLNEKEFLTESVKLREAFRVGNELIRARSIMEFEAAFEAEQQKQIVKEKAEAATNDTNISDTTS